MAGPWSQEVDRLLEDYHPGRLLAEKSCTLYHWQIYLRMSLVFQREKLISSGQPYYRDGCGTVEQLTLLAAIFDKVRREPVSGSPSRNDFGFP
jgi:hypothetical protein